MASTPSPSFTHSTRFARLIHVVECVSTQDLALADPRAGCAVYWADHQTRGRGRQGRVWYDGPGLDVAATFRLEGITLPRPTRLPAIVPLAVLRAIAGFASVRATLKWPNDVMVEGRKVAGILIDADGTPPMYAIGVGVNVGRTSFPAELMDSATSLALLTGVEVPRARVIEALAQRVDDAVSALLEDRVGEWSEAFRTHTGLVGRDVAATVGSRIESGRVADLDLDQITFADRRTFPLAIVQSIRHK